VQQLPALGVRQQVKPAVRSLADITHALAQARQHLLAGRYLAGLQGAGQPVPARGARHRARCACGPADCAVSQSAGFDLANIMHDAARASGALSTTAQKARAATCAGV